MSDLLTDLNPEQRRAVEYGAGPLLILAGAGSGKTKTLTERIAHLVLQKNVSPLAICAVTFTNKAAGEMRQRVLDSTGQNLPYLGTFHSLSVRILRASGAAIGLKPTFVIYDAADQLSVMKSAFEQLKIDDKVTPPRAVLSLISSAKNELIDDKNYPRFATTPMQRKASELYPIYQKILTESNALDFDDLIMKTVQLLRTNPEALEMWAGRFEYVLVDEYQDTNTAQYEMTKLLSSRHGNICVVGDDWQSIYSWRGADYRNILNFEQDWPGAMIIKLEQNYRSTKAILEAAHQIISKNQQRSDKKLWTAQGSGQPVQILSVANERQEAELIAQKIRSSVDIKARTWRDFALLYRTNAQSRALEDVLVRYAIPYRIVGGTRFYDRQEIRDILSYLRILHQPSDMVAFKRLLSVPPRGIGPVTEQRLLAELDPADLIANLAQAAPSIPKLSQKAKTNLVKTGNLLKRFSGELQNERRLSQVVTDLIEGIGFIDYLDDGTPRAEERIENVRELISVASEYDHAGLSGFLEEVALVSDIDQWDSRADAISLMTLHAAKGLEFPVVFMTGMEEGIFPHTRSLSDPEGMEEERRLCYVGMTRAREELILLHANNRLLYGTTQSGIPSRFLSDIADLASTSPLALDQTPASQIPADIPEVQSGDSVEHPFFGEGIVSNREGDTVTVTFKGRGSKTLNLAFAPLVKK